MVPTLLEKEFSVLGGGSGAKIGHANGISTNKVKHANWNSLFIGEKIDTSARKLHFHQPQSINDGKRSSIPAIDFCKIPWLGILWDVVLP